MGYSAGVAKNRTLHLALTSSEMLGKLSNLSELLGFGPSACRLNELTLRKHLGLYLGTQ